MIETQNAQDYVEHVKFVSLIAVYERCTGLTLQSIRQDAHSIHIDWAYDDGSWAGTTCCDAPLNKAIEKLDREVGHLQAASEPVSSDRYITAMA